MTIEAERTEDLPEAGAATPPPVADSAAADSVVTRRSSSGGDIATIAIATALAAFLFGIVAMLIAANNDGGGGSSAAATDAVGVEMSDFSFNLATEVVEAGEVVFAVANKGPSDHNFVMDGVATSNLLKQGQRETINLGILEEGTYTFYCNLAGHRDAGMEGKLTVGAPGTASVAGGKESFEAVDAAHEKVVTEFLTGPPAKTEGQGGLVAAHARVEAGVKVYELTARVVQWEVAPGRKMEAWTYNGAVPGPQIRLKQGERIKVRLKNDLPQSTSIHWHGLELADVKQDGVTFVTQDPIKPGETFEYDLTPLNCGSHMYHSHHSADAQVPLGLLGAMNIECTTTPTPAFYEHDSEQTLILTDGPLGFGINGKGFPATSPVVAKRGEKTMVRFMNEGLIIHPMHLHGHRMTVVAKDGNFLPLPYEVDTLNIAPGERYDVIVSSLYPGVWAFHCHILTHAESDAGLHGMTTVWIVQ